MTIHQQPIGELPGGLDVVLLTRLKAKGSRLETSAAPTPRLRCPTAGHATCSTMACRSTGSSRRCRRISKRACRASLASRRAEQAACAAAVARCEADGGQEEGEDEVTHRQQPAPGRLHACLHARGEFGRTPEDSRRRQRGRILQRSRGVEGETVCRRLVRVPL